MRANLLPALLLISACSTGPDIKTDFDPAANFASYRSYSWIYSQAPQGMNPLQYERIRASIDRSLTARGYTKADPGDFAVAFTIGARDRVEVSDFGPYAPFYPGWGVGYGFGWAPRYNQVDIRNVTDGTLAIDFYDVSTKRPLWHATASQEITPGEVSQQQVDTAVDQVISRFPPQQK